MPIFHCLWQANDVEENPGPTIFDVVDPTRTICAGYSRGNEALFGENAVRTVGKVSAQPHTIVNKSVFPTEMYCFCHCFLCSRTECIM